MTRSNIGKVFIGMVLLAGSARAGQWQFARESTLVPAGPAEVALGIQTLRVHAPAGVGNANVVTVDILDLDQQVVGHLVDAKAAAAPSGRGQAPEQTIELMFQGRTVKLHYRDRALWISDGVSTASASFDRTNPEDIERVKAFTDDLSLIAGIQVAAKSAVDRAATPVRAARAGVWGSFRVERVARLTPALDEATCYTDPSHAKCAGGFGASKSSACAYSQQEANNECAAASGWCIGCCAWVGSACDCACLIGDLACMCESCGGLCGPSARPVARPSPESRQRVER